MDETTHGEAPPPDGAAPESPAGPLGEETQHVAPVVVRGEPETVPLPSGTPSPPVQYQAGAAAVPAPSAPADPGWLSPTLTLTGPAGVAAAGESDHFTAGRPRRPRWWIAAAVAIVVIIAMLVVVLHGRSGSSSPARSVGQYFDDLAAGDTAGAMTLVDDPGAYSPSGNPLLSPIVLSGAADRPSRATVTGTAATAADGGRAGTAVSVTYTVGGAVVHQTITVLARAADADASQPPYLLKAPFITVAVPSSGGRAITVNGIVIPAGTAHTLGFPGAYTATAAGNRLIASATATTTYASTSGTVEARIALPAATVAAGATAAVQAAVNRALSTCAASTSPAPAKCPFSYPDSSATMKWTIVSQPQVSLVVKGGSVIFDDNDHPAVVDYTAATSYLFGLIPHTATGSTNARVTGTAALVGGVITVTFGP